MANLDEQSRRLQMLRNGMTDHHNETQDLSRPENLSHPIQRDSIDSPLGNSAGATQQRLSELLDDVTISVRSNDMGSNMPQSNIPQSDALDSWVDRSVRSDPNTSVPGYPSNSFETISNVEREAVGEEIHLGNDGNTAISIRGRADGIFIEIGRGSWSELMLQLSERLQQAAGFFRGGKVVLDVGMRSLVEDELHHIWTVLQKFGMTLSAVSSASEETCEAAVAFGLAASLNSPGGMNAQNADSNHETLTHFVYRGNLRSGQVLSRQESIIVLGDVNPGAEVASQGDILVWGRLRGIAHAGISGDIHSIVAALSMQPTQLRIANLITVLPEQTPSRIDKLLRRQSGRRPEIGYIKDGQVIVELWDESIPGGIMAYRR